MYEITKLEWVEKKRPMRWRAKSSFGWWYIIKLETVYVYGLEPYGDISTRKSLEEAKAAADADNRQRMEQGLVKVDICNNFEVEESTTSATICKHCGKEKHLHKHFLYQEQK